MKLSLKKKKTTEQNHHFKSIGARSMLTKNKEI